MDLSVLLSHPTIITAEFVAPMIFRLAANRKEQREGQCEISARFRPTVGGPVQEPAVTITWSVPELDKADGTSRFRDDLRKLRDSKSEWIITQVAALGVAFCLVSQLLPDEQITRVVTPGGKGDYYLNGRRDEMIEVSGTMKRSLAGLFTEKKGQILQNKRLTKAYVSVTRFAPLASKLERVR